VLQCVAVCCSVLQCVAVRCSVVVKVHMRENKFVCDNVRLWICYGYVMDVWKEAFVRWNIVYTKKGNCGHVKRCFRDELACERRCGCESACVGRFFFCAWEGTLVDVREGVFKRWTIVYTPKNIVHTKKKWHIVCTQTKKRFIVYTPKKTLNIAYTQQKALD